MRLMADTPTSKKNTTAAGRVIPNWQGGGIGGSFLNRRGGCFQKDVKDTELEYLMLRDGASRRIVVGPAKEALKRPPQVLSQNDKLQVDANKLLTHLGYDQALQAAYTSARAFGYGLVLLGLTTAEGLDKPVTKPGSLEAVTPLWKTQVKKLTICDDPKDMTYYGKIVSYTIQVQVNGATQDQVIHASRVQHIVHQVHANSPEGVSVLLPVFNTLQAKLNMDYSLAHAIYRYAQPFSTLELPLDADEEEFLEVSEMFYLDDRNEFVMPSGYKIQQYGASGALNPQPYVDYMWANLCSGTEFNKTAMVGNEAGAITGSWVNLAEYYAQVAAIQSNILAPQGYADLVTRLQGWGLLTQDDFSIEWPLLWELDQKELAERHDIMARAAFTEAMALEKYWAMKQAGLPITIGYDDTGWYITPADQVDAKHYMFSLNKGAVRASSHQVLAGKAASTVQLPGMNIKNRAEAAKLKALWAMQLDGLKQKWHAKLGLMYMDLAQVLEDQVAAILDEHKIVGNIKLNQPDPDITAAAEAVRTQLSIPVTYPMAQAYADLMKAAHKAGYLKTTQTMLLDGTIDPAAYVLEDSQAQAFLERSELLWEQKQGEILAGAKWGLIEGIKAGEGYQKLYDRLQSSMAEVARPMTLVNTETHIASELGRAHAYGQSGVVYVEWLTVGDDLVRDTHQEREGKIYPLEVAERLIQEPNCRCTLVPLLTSEVDPADVEEGDY